MRIAIVGAGIGGLSTAIGLQRAGADVTVFERAVDLRSGGSGLSIFANGMRALDAIEVGDAIRAVTSSDARLARSGQRRPDGTWLATVPAGAVSELRIIDRAVLHELMVGSLAAGTIRAGARVVEASTDGRIVFDQCEERRTEGFDLVVAADGLRSGIRRGLFPDVRVRYAGYVAWRGITDVAVSLAGEAGETWGVGRRFGVAPLVDGRVYWFGVATRPEHARRDDAGELRRLFEGWHAPIPAVLEATSGERVQRLPIHDLAGGPSSCHRGRVVLLGDAAHAMTPNLGQGGGQAMEDAATLTRLLQHVAASTPDAETLERALARYDALRLPRTRRISRASRMIGDLAHVRGPVAASVRDAVLRATPERALRRQLAWLQSWEPPQASAPGD